ncbi:tetratricopeptide repeat protein [Bernardetia sp. ABR2-2B]|uniref:tetratricopeptide repeat protein n=1 Tax=Bernardetia sp. ABR2-2B TaxID=3127472 RepID=UPI0030CB0D2A
MQIKQYSLIAAGVGLVALLAFLPKGVVKNDADASANRDKGIVSTSSSLNRESENTIPDGHSEDDGHDHSNSDFSSEETQDGATQHLMTVSEEDKALLNSARTLYFEVANRQNSNHNDKHQALENFVESLKKISLFDSAAYYLAIEADENPTLGHNLAAADAYYEASVFAINPKKASAASSKAKRYYELVLKEDPKNTDVKAQLAMTYVTTTNPMQGIAMLREVLEENPNHIKATENLGLLSVQSGQYDKAVTRFEKLVELTPDDVSAHLYLGVSYKETGAKEKAKKQLEFVFDNATDPALKEAAKEYLKGL